MKAGIVVFPGTNCDRDTKGACELFGWETEYVWHDETSLDKYDVIFLPGGFSMEIMLEQEDWQDLALLFRALMNMLKNKEAL